MMKKIGHRKTGRSCLGQLDSQFHFSLTEYYNPENMHYGVLRVVNDDMIQPHTSLEAYPHRDMEIITYVIEGELTHAGNMQNASTPRRGEVQYMNVNTGVFHSEENDREGILRLL